MRAAKIDRNHLEVALALRKMGYSVFSLAACGRGCPDILASKHGRNYLVEVKSEKGKLTPAQVKFHESWRGFINVVRSLEDLEKLS